MLIWEENLYRYLARLLLPFSHGWQVWWSHVDCHLQVQIQIQLQGEVKTEVPVGEFPSEDKYKFV